MADVTINKKLRNSDAGIAASTTFNSVTKDPSAFQLEIGRKPVPPAPPAPQQGGGGGGGNP